MSVIITGRKSQATALRSTELRVVRFEYAAVAKIAVVIAFWPKLRTGIGSMAVALNCDCTIAEFA